MNQSLDALSSRTPFQVHFTTYGRKKFSLDPNGYSRCYINDERLLWSNKLGPIIDSYLVFAARQGDSDAFRRIYEKYRDSLLALAIALSNDIYIAEDSVQDTFVYFAEHLDGFSVARPSAATKSFNNDVLPLSWQ